MIITLTDGTKIVTRKPVTFTQKPLPSGHHHRRYLAYQQRVGRGKYVTHEVPVKEVLNVRPGYKP